MHGIRTDADPEAGIAEHESLATRVLMLEEENCRLTAELASATTERDQVRIDLEALNRERDALAGLARLVFQIDEERTAVLLDGIDTLQYHCEQFDAITRRRDPDRVPNPQPRSSHPWDGNARALDLLSAAIDVIAAHERITRAEAIAGMRDGADAEEALRDLCRRLEERDRASHRRGRPRKRAAP